MNLLSIKPQIWRKKFFSSQRKKTNFVLKSYMEGSNEYNQNFAKQNF